MIVTLSRTYRFEASHRLEHLPVEHPCHHLHGHGYTIEIQVSGAVNESTGFLIDYAEMDTAMQPLLAQLDHKHLNDLSGLRLATTEFLCKWLWEKLRQKLDMVSLIAVSETPTSRCEYRGE